MPIPQLDKKKSQAKKGSARSASDIRKKRAQERAGEALSKKTSTKETSKTKSSAAKNRIKKTTTTGKQKGSKKKGEKTTGGRPQNWKEWLLYPFRRERILKTAGIAVAVCLVLGVGTIVAAFAWVSQDLASIEDVEKRTVSSATRIYANDGETVLYEIGDNKRIEKSYDHFDEKIPQAIVALEDKRFYEHSGYDLIGITRALWKFTLSGGDLSSAQGASTLTQQFVGNVVLTRERKIERKLKELILAVRLEQKYSKEKILEFYMNDVYFGPNYQGVEVTAQEYFGKSASNVTLSEAAILASLPKNPVTIPKDPERLKSRRDYAITVMAELGYITNEEAEAAKAEEVPVLDYTTTEITAPHFVFEVIDYLDETYGQTTVRRGGLRVTTTLDLDKQEKAQNAINNGIEKVEQYGGSNAALVSIDAHTGQVLAMVGSRDYFADEYDGQVNVATSLRQPGSSFKPLVYLTAFDKGYTPDTKLFDVETDFLTEAEGKYHPRNYDLSESGPVTLRHSLATSLNITAVKILYLVGVDEALNVAEKFGYTSLTDRSRFGLSLVLGGAEVSLLEHTAAFATFAREGQRHNTSLVLKVEDMEGNVLEEWQDIVQDVMNPEAVRALNNVLSDSNARAGFSALNLADRQVAAKTGTTNDYRDAWTMGYTPSLATGVWVGNNDNSEMSRGAAGLIVAAPIWNEYMSAVLTGQPAEAFNGNTLFGDTEILSGEIEQTVEKRVDKFTQELIPEECETTYPEEFVELKEFKETHTILHYLTKDNPTGGAPEDPRSIGEIMYEPWETAVVRWREDEERKDQYLSDDTPTIDCSIRDEAAQPTAKILSFEDSESVTVDDFIFTGRFTPGEGRTITTVQFTVDDVLVDSQSVELSSRTKVTSSYTADTLTDGRHDITVTAIDDVGNSASETITIRFSSETSTKKKNDTTDDEKTNTNTNQ